MKQFYRDDKTMNTAPSSAPEAKRVRSENSHWVYVVLTLMLGLVLGACGTSYHGTADQQIVSSINSKLNQDPDLRTLTINVAAKQGVVTLSGSVNAPVEKLAVEDVARKTAGVKQVVDQLTVASVAADTGSPTPAPEEAAASPPRHHNSRLSEASSAPENQTPPASQEAQNSAPPAPDNSPQAQDSSQPAPDNSPAAQPNSQPAGSGAPALAATSEPQPAPPPAPPPPQQVTVPSGTVVHLRMIDSISSGTAQPGEIYRASLSTPIILGGQAVVPRGANARVRVVDVQAAGHFQGQPLLKLELVGFTVNGIKYSTKSDYYSKVGPSRGKNTAEKVGGGAAIGTLLGALIGHGKGAGIGAIVGAGGGTIDQRATQPQEVKIASEAKINFTLKRPFSITVSGGQ
jgi:hypothetical protein